VARYGETPGDDAPERDRIRVHLEWVAAELRSRDVSHLSPDLRERRAWLLGELRAYAARGRFPRLDAPSARRPRFIDHRGVACAVGHLVEVSAGRDVAEAVADAHEHDYLWDIDMPEARAWIATSGFTPRELAMIQPTYGFRPTPEPPEPPRVVEPLSAANVRLDLGRYGTSIARSCVRRSMGDRAVQVRILAGAKRGRELRVRVATAPSDARAERCVGHALRRVIRSRRRTLTVGAPFRVHRVVRVPARRTIRPTPTPTPAPPPGPQPTPAWDEARAHRALDARRAALLACLPGARAGVPGSMTLRVRVNVDGRAALVSASLPPGVGRVAVLRCLATRVRALRVPHPPGAPTVVTHTLSP